MDPPARNAMWRFGFPNPVNYNDNELFCGGYAGQLTSCCLILYKANYNIYTFQSNGSKILEIVGYVAMPTILEAQDHMKQVVRMLKEL